MPITANDSAVLQRILHPNLPDVEDLQNTGKTFNPLRIHVQSVSQHIFIYQQNKRSIRITIIDE